jgi:hypothetical protein
MPDYVPLVGDLNGDCKVDDVNDDVNMALLQQNWLKDNRLTEECVRGRSTEITVLELTRAFDLACSVPWLIFLCWECYYE